MSTTHAPPAPLKTDAPNRIKIYGHSTLFYWWPVWAVCFILAILTATQKNVMAVVPAGTKVYDATVKMGDEKVERKVLVPPTQKQSDELEAPRLHIARKKSYGVLFAIVLLLIIVITNVPMRGMMSVAVIMLIVMLSLFFALFGMWDKILAGLDLLDIRVNMAGYLFIAIGLLIIWLLAFFVFDGRVYMIFAPGQVTVCLAVGDAESSYEATGALVHKVPSDLFRHWILGMGSGDLEVRTSGSNAQAFQLHNVLGISRKLKVIQDLLRLRQERSA